MEFEDGRLIILISQFRVTLPATYPSKCLHYEHTPSGYSKICFDLIEIESPKPRQLQIKY